MQPYLHKGNNNNNNNTEQPPDNWLARKLMFFCSQYVYSRVHARMYTCDVHTYISIPMCTYVCVCVCTRVVVVGANCCVVWQTLREHSNSNAPNDAQFSSVKMLQKINFRKNVCLKKYKVYTHTHIHIITYAQLKHKHKHGHMHIADSACTLRVTFKNLLKCCIIIVMQNEWISRFLYYPIPSLNTHNLITSCQIPQGDVTFSMIWPLD